LKVKKSRKMQSIEISWGEPLEYLLPRLINETNQSGAADKIGISRATLTYWLLKLGVVVERVALAPGETVAVS